MPVYAVDLTSLAGASRPTHGSGARQGLPRGASDYILLTAYGSEYISSNAPKLMASHSRIVFRARPKVIGPPARVTRSSVSALLLLLVVMLVHLGNPSDPTLSIFFDDVEGSIGSVKPD